MDELESLLKLGRKLEREPALVPEFAEKLLRVRDRAGLLRPLRANAAQLAFEARRGRQNIVLKARQMGITTWVSGRFFLRTITRPGTLTLQVAHTQAAAEAIFRTVQRMWEELPVCFREGPLRRSRANVGQMVFPVLDSEFRVASANDVGAGRGLSVQNLHCSEVSRWPGDAAATLAGLRAALTPDGELVLESTPFGAYGCFYEEWLGGVESAGFGVEGFEVWRSSVEAHISEARYATPASKGARWGPRCATPASKGARWGPRCGAPDLVDGLVRHFLPWWLESAYVGAAVARETMREEELALVERHGLTAEQIGFRRTLERQYGVLRSQEFAEDAETCFRATGSCWFDVEAIERRLAELTSPLATRRGGALQIWFVPQPGKRYLVAVDTAGGGEDGDFAAVQVIERATGLQCAELQERLRPVELARVAVEIAREYNEALLVVERNNHGGTVLAMVDVAERYAHVYRQGSESGWLTTGVSKPEMVARLGVVLEQTPGMLRSRRLLGECRTFVAGDRGRMGAASGTHDDLVMAMAMAQEVRVEGGSRGVRSKE